MSDPATLVKQVESSAQRKVTRCGGASTVWHIWGQGRPLVLVHGASGSWTHWIRNIPPLAAHFRVVVPDVPGFGDSDLPAEPHTAEAFAELLARGLDDVVSNSEALDIAGFSFGGIIGGLVAARLGRRVGTMVLIGSGGLGLPLAAMPPLRRVDAAMSADAVRAAHRENLGVLMIARPESIDDLAVYVQTQNVHRARFKTGSIPASDVLLQALPSIEARICGIWGEDDAFAVPRIDERRRLLSAIRQDVDFRVIDGAGHWVIYEASDRVNAALLDMLLPSAV